MRISIVALGRARISFEAKLFEYYSDKLTQWKITLIEKEVRKQVAPNKTISAEGDLISRAIPKDSFLVALDENGKQVSSKEFANILSHQKDFGCGEITFLIGGANGLSPTLITRADLVLSLGRLTWPHLLARVLLIEQIYRAQQIIIGHPYHRG